MTTPDTPPTGTVGPTWVDNMSMANLNAAVQDNTSLVQVQSQQSTNSQRFWSTPSRPASSTIKEVIQVTLASTRKINKISFDVAAFPHDVMVEYFEVATNAWTPCLDGNAARPVPITHRVVDSMPAVLPPISTVTGHLHPQHSYSGHWRHLVFDIRPAETSTLRIILSRTTAGTPPVTSLGNEADYSLAVRNLYLGYSITSLAHVPYKQPNPNSASRGTFATTSDMFGSVVNFAVRVNQAENVLQPPPTTQDALTTVWKSQPMPIPWAVVNFYVDARDADGNAQVLDRFFVDPLHSGPKTNLYYSNDEPTSAFRAGSDPLNDQVAIVHDDGGVSGDVLHSGTAGPVGTIAFVDVDNRALDFNASRPWWIGAKLNLKFSHGIQTTTNPIFDCDEFSISMTPFGLRFSTKHGDTLGINLDPFDPATPLAFTVGYDGTQVRVNARVGLLDYSDTITLSVPLKNAVKILRFGGYQDFAPQSGDFDLNSFSLKTDVVLTDEVSADFITNPDPYVLASEFMGVNDPKTDNALLRYSYKFSNTNYRSGMIGGAPDRYFDMSWSPISRDYVLRSGFMQFPPTSGKYWKFEFCNLTPQVQEVYKPVVKSVMTFPSGMWISSQPINLTASAKSQIAPGIDSSLIVNSMSQTLDGSRTVYVGTGGNGKTFSDTTARVLTDAEVRKRIGGAYWAWNFLPLHPVSATPAFERAGKHTYEVVNYQAEHKIGYFVGLRSIQAFRLDYISTDDTPQYVEMFHDTNNLDSSTNWYLGDQHRMTSGDAAYAELRSKEMVSNRVVTAVQFAAQQSDAVQLLPDDDFTDPNHTNWQAIGDGVLSNTPVASQVLGSSVRLDRSMPPLTWDGVTVAGTFWSTFDSQNASFNMVQQGTTTSGDSGGVTSQAVVVPGGGRVYAAARATSPNDLVSPLYVQIYDEETGYVVSENSAVVKANKVSEWYTSYTVGDTQGGIPFRWKDFSSTVSTAVWSDSFVRVNSTTLNSMDTGQAWSWPLDVNSLPMSLAISSNKAVVTTEGFSNSIDVNTPWGTLEFKVGAMGTTTAGEVMLALFSPLFLDDKGVINNSAGAAFSGIRGNVLTTNGSARSVVANDDIRIDIVPTIYVPAGKEDISLTPGLDPVYNPYSLMFYLNNVWVRTFSHDLGARPLMGIKGRLNQQFVLWSWTPKIYGPLSGSVHSGLPRAGNGAWLDVDTQTTWIDSRNQVWSAVGSWDTTTAVETAGRDDVGAPLTAASSGAVFYTDTNVWDGTLSVYLRNVAGAFGATQPAGRHGNVLCLDFDNNVYLDYQGRVVANGISQGSLFTAPLATNATITVQFVSLNNLNPANRGGIDPAVFPRMLVGKVNGVTQGTLVTTASQAWTGTKRGVAGDIYDPTGGTRPVAASYTLDTSFRAINWAPDATNVAADSSAPTWDNVTAKGTVTYDNWIADRSLVTPKFRARVVQKGPSYDVWDMDALSLYADPIIWLFSNDGGYVYYPAYDTRNNPNGVMAFPTTANVPVVDINQKPGTSLVWKAISYKAGSMISSLVLRPWYAGLLSGVTHRPGLVAHGPNVMSFDHFGAIEKDSRFQTWSLPIPRDWWYQFRIIKRSAAIRSGAITVPTASSSLLLSQSLITDIGG